MEKKNPVVKQDGKEMPINMANAYRMQNRAMLELLGIYSPEQLASLSPEQKATIPSYPPYDELGSSGKVNAAMHMMRTVIDSLTSDTIMRIYDRVSHLEDVERKMDMALNKLDELSRQDAQGECAPDHNPATVADIRAIRDDLASYINGEVVGRMVNPEEMCKFITGVNEFIAKHGEFVQAFSTFVAASSDNSAEGDKHNADILSAIYDVKTTLSTLSDMSRRIINISDQLFDMQHAPRTSSIPEPVAAPKNVEAESSSGAYAPSCKITIHGDNNGTLNIGTASGCTTFTDDDDDSGESDDPDDDYPEDDCDSDHDSWDDDEEDDDDDYPEQPPFGSYYQERRNRETTLPLGEGDELNVLSSKGNGSVVPCGIIDDIRLYAFEIFNHYFRNQSNPHLSIFHLNRLFDEMGTRYAHSAALCYVRSLSGNVLDNFYGIIRNEIVRLVLAENSPSPDEMEDFILYNLGLAYNELFLEGVAHPTNRNNGELNRLIMNRLTNLCNDLEDELPALCTLLSYATYYPKLAKCTDFSSYTIKEYLLNADLFNKARNMTRSVAMGKGIDEDGTSTNLEDNLFTNPDHILNLEEYVDSRNFYFAENLIRYGVDGCQRLYDKVRENAIKEFHAAEENDETAECVFARIMDAIYGFRGFSNSISPNVVKTMIERMGAIVKDAMYEVQHQTGDDCDAADDVAETKANPSEEG